MRNLRILIIFLKTPIFIFPQWFNPGHDVKKKKNKCGCKTRGETAVIHTMSSTDRRLCEEKEILNNQAKGLGWFLSYGFYLSLWDPCYLPSCGWSRLHLTTSIFHRLVWSLARWQELDKKLTLLNPSSGSNGPGSTGSGGPGGPGPGGPGPFSGSARDMRCKDGAG